MRPAIAAIGLALLLVAAPSVRTPRHTQPRFIPESASFVSPEVGWAWGPAVWPTAATAPGVLARTTDGGRSWRMIGPAALRYADPSLGPVIDVAASTGSSYAEALGCATCATAYLYRIRDGRLSRIGPTLTGGGAQLVVDGRAVYILAGNTVGRPATLWASEDAGLTWRRLTAPCTWLGGAALAAWSATSLALACGEQPGAGNQAKDFYASTDGGVSWRLTGRIGFTPGHGFTVGYVASLAAASAATWVLGEARGGIMVSADGGRTWRWAKFTGATASVEGFGSVSFTDAAHGVAVPWTLNGDVLAFTADGGRRWREISFGS